MGSEFVADGYALTMLKSLGNVVVWLIALALIASAGPALAWPTFGVLAVVGLVVWVKRAAAD